MKVNEQNEEIVPTGEIGEDIIRDTGLSYLDLAQIDDMLAVFEEPTDADVMNTRTSLYIQMKKKSQNISRKQCIQSPRPLIKSRNLGALLEGMKIRVTLFFNRSINSKNFACIHFKF